MGRLLVAAVVMFCVSFACAGEQSGSPGSQGLNGPSRGTSDFTALFNGRDLSGWRGMGHLNPYEAAKWTEEERRTRQAEADENMRRHWRVEDGEIVNDGQGVYLTTEKDYGDIELLLEWRMTKPGTDSGVYLRATPQVQIWDPDHESLKQHGAEKGSGGLWNNQGDGKWPLVRADRPIGEWNTFRIVMVGERVTVYLNDQLVVDHARLDNFWDRNKPLLRTGPIQFQTHGGEMWFRNILIREIGAEEANRILQSHKEEGFTSLFNGRDMDGWIGAVDDYEVRDGLLVCREGRGGTIFTKDEYQDFIVRHEFNLPPGGNNGLGIRAPLDGHPSFDGMEIQILDDDHPKYKDLKDWQFHGSLYGVAPSHRGYLRPSGEWNYQEVVVRGSRVEVHLNGTKINDVDLSTAKSLHDRAHPGIQRTRGHIGLLGHRDPVAFRNIRVKPL